MPLGRRTYQKSLQTFVWRADDGDDDKLQFDVYFRREGETDWKVLRRALWDGIYTWDTTSVPDGTYVIKVMASDAPSNSPAGALTAERESATFEIDNTPPTIDVRPAGQAATPANAVFVVRDSHSPIQRVEYSTSAGGWKLLYPVDGLLDAREERFELARDPASTEPIVLRAIDTLSNVATAVLPAPSAKPAPRALIPSAQPTPRTLSLFLDKTPAHRRDTPIDEDRMGRDSPCTASAGLLPGTLEMLILRVLQREALHGYAIAQRLKDVSHDVLQVGESSLYPALQRLLLNGFVDAEWGPSENNRRARYYSLTAAGRKQLAAERAEFDRLVTAIHRVLQSA